MAQAATTIHWLHDFDEGLTQAAPLDKYVPLDFSAAPL